jgi:hypothetical protein
MSTTPNIHPSPELTLKKFQPKAVALEETGTVVGAKGRAGGPFTEKGLRG